MHLSVCIPTFAYVCKYIHTYVYAKPCNQELNYGTVSGVRVIWVHEVQDGQR